MKTANKVLALGLCMIMLMLTVGCQQKDSERLLPFGLELGDDYEKINNELDIGELRDASANDGYVIDNLKTISEEERITEILGTSEGISDVAIGLAFNADKKLYEFYCFFTLENDKFSEINNIIQQKYNKLAGEAEEDPEGIALWKNEKYVIDYSCDDPVKAWLGEDVSYTIVIHSLEFDFE